MVHRTPRAKQYEALLFSRTWSENPTEEKGYKIGKEMSRRFGAAKSLRDPLRRRFEKEGLQSGWRLTPRGGLDFMENFLNESALILLNPTASAATPSKELEQIYDLVKRPAEMVLGFPRGGLSPSNQRNIAQLIKFAREHHSEFRDLCRRKYGEDRAAVLLRIVDMVLGQMTRDFPTV